MGFENVITEIKKVELRNPETGEVIMSFTPSEWIEGFNDICNISNEGEDTMIRIVDVNVEYEEKTFVDDTKRDENGNYTVTKKEVPVATVVTFENGNCQVALCDDNDEFNIETGISICVTRELMERLYGICGYTNAYNKVMRNGLKVYEKACKKKELLEKKKAEQEAVEKNRKIKEQKRRQKRAEKKKEREIKILAEAIKRANADSK